MASPISVTSPAGFASFAVSQTAPRHGFVIAVGAPPRHGKTSLALGVPGGFLIASKSGRLAPVVGATAGAPGENYDGEDAVSAFRLAMEVFKISQRPIALVRSPTDLLLQETFNTAKDCMVMVEFLLVKAPVHQDIVKELIPVGHAILIVESQAKEGYVKADALVNAIQGLKMVGKTFFADAKLPEYSVPVVPPATDDVDRDSFFKELINLFVVFYTALYWKARKRYKFGIGGAN